MHITTTDDAHAIERLYHEYRRPIEAYLARLIGDREAAEDLCQETFLKALRGWAGHNPAASPVGWLYRIAANTAYDHLRRGRRAHFAPLIEADSLPDAQAPDTRMEQYEPVHSALAQLPPQYRVPLLLQVCEGRSLCEIAALLGCSQDAVKMRLLRARARFRQVYRH